MGSSARMQSKLSTASALGYLPSANLAHPTMGVNMRIRRMAKRLVVAAATVLALTGTAVVATSAPAAAANCKTVYLDNGGYWWSAIRPKMWVPVCYDGSHIWQNGNVTGGVDTTGYMLDGIDWSGTYNGGGNWLGAGMNYRVTTYGTWASFSCASRWSIDAWGNKTSFDRGC